MYLNSDGSPVSRQIQAGKNWGSLRGKIFAGAIKKCLENFSVLLAVRRTETLGRSIGKILWILLKESSDMSSRHHH
ncbi:MAG: hypothetical protein BME93_06680 [Methanosarcinales archaeon Met12]|nr:MAG: hypothetical protein BME93_06680 [Methanosarcinales archaeon Met12]